MVFSFMIMNERENFIMISFRPMKRLMKKRGITQYQLLKEGILLPAHVTRLSYNHNFTLKFIDKLCRELDCQPGDFIEYVENNDACPK